jgi:cyclase
VVEQTARHVFIPLTVGGGVRSVDDARAIIRAGADKISVNSAAVNRPELLRELSEEFGSQAVVLAIDARTDGRGWKVYTRGGRQAEQLDAVQWAQYGEQLGAGEILLTSMDADGMKHGFDLPLTAAVRQSVQLPVIASGGAGTVQHFADVLSTADAALAASVFHFGTFSIEEVKSCVRTAGIVVRS